MTTTVLGMSISLDGFIGLPNGDDGGLHDWLFGGDIPYETEGIEFKLQASESLDVFKRTLDRTGAFVLGRVLFEASSRSAPFNRPTVVLSRTMPATDSFEDNVRVTDADLQEALDIAHSAAGDRATYIFGGASVARQYLRAGLVDEIELTVAPLLLGDGLRIHDVAGGRLQLELLDLVRAGDVTHQRFRVPRD